MPRKPTTRLAILQENAELRARLDEAEEMVRAIRGGEVDAFVIQSPTGPLIYSLQGQDAEASRFRGEILAQINDAVIAADSEGRVVYLNAAAERLYGFSASLALGRPLPNIYKARWLHPEDEVEAKTTLRERGEWRGEKIHVRNDGREINVESGITALREIGGQPTGTIAVIRDVTERKKTEAHVKSLMAEVNHRAQNMLAVVQAIAHQTAKYGDPATFVARLSGRIDGLAAGQALLVSNQFRGVEVTDLVEAQMADFKGVIGTRVHLEGPRMQLTMAAAQGIGMALHELATNAAKHGALSNLDGHVRISWQVIAAAKPTFSMSWLEDGGPKVATPTHKGFGHIVIGRMAEAAVEGMAEIVFREHGLSWTLRAPAESALTPDGTEAW